MEMPDVWLLVMADVVVVIADMVVVCGKMVFLSMVEMLDMVVCSEDGRCGGC